MSDASDRALGVVVADSPAERAGPLRAAIADSDGLDLVDTDGGVAVVDDAGGLADAADEGVDGTLVVSDPDVVDCAVCPTLDAYDRVRESAQALPAVVVAPDPDEASLERIIDDDRADYVNPAGALDVELPARIEVLADPGGDEAAWQLADFAESVIVEFDPDTFALLEANEAFFERWGWDRDAFLDATLVDLRETDITHELRGQGRGADGEEELEWIDDEDPVASMIERARGGGQETREWHCIAADGTAFKSAVELVVDEANTSGFLVADVPPVDGSDHEDRTEDEGAMLRSLVEHVPMSVYFKDTESRHVLVSEDVVEPFIESPEGKIMHTPEDVHGKTDFDLYEGEHAERAVADDREIIESGEPIRDRIEHVQPPNGMDLFFQTTKAPWYDSDGLTRGTIGVTVDVTEQKHRERELDRQNERLEEFAGILSHDLRNPLNVARGHLQLYERDGDEAALAKVEEMHDRMEDLVSEILEYAREGSHIEAMEWFDPTQTAAEAWGTVDTGSAEFEQAWDYVIRADPDRLGRLFENLYRNAIEHGGEAVTVRVGTLEDEPGFYVEDDGPGIPADDREAIFDRGVTSNDEGTGFGLAIVREIAEAHGWSISATEGSDGGARFEVTGVTRGDSLRG